MNKRDGVFLGLMAAGLAALLAPALFMPGRILGNFGDVYTYHYPLRHLVASLLQEGRLPFWDPYIFSGMPLLANSQAAVFYPGSALFYLLPIGAAFDWHAALHLALAGLGMHLWARANRFEPAAACLFATAFCLSPFLVYRIPQGIPTHLAALSYIPWCWLALQSGRRGLLAAAWSLQLLSGHPEFAVLNAGAMALFAGISALRGRPEPLGVFLREGTAAAGLVLVQYFLTAEFLMESNRVGLPRVFASAYSTPWSAWATVLWPGAWGDPLRGSFAALPSEFFEEYALYAGAIPLALALAALAGGARTERHGGPMPAAWFGWLIAGLGVFFAAGEHNPVLRILAEAGSWSLSRTPARYAVWTLWGLLLAAAGGWSALRHQLKAPAWRAALLALTVLDLGLWASRFIYAEDLAPFLQPRENLVAELAGRPVRFLSDPVLANPDKALLYRMMDVNGYDAYFLARYAAYAARSEGGPAADPSRTYLRRAGTAEMRALGVSRVLSPRELPGGGVPIAGNIRLFSNPGALPLARVEDAAGVLPATADMDGPNAWSLSGEVRAPESRLVLGVPYFPGWSAWVDGRRATPELHDGLLQSIPLEGLASGAAFKARFLFRPTAWAWLCVLGAGAWLAWFAFAPAEIFR